MANFDIALADLRQDVAGVVPPALVLEWNAQAKSAERHRSILAPYRVLGTLVCSDSAGLSALAQRCSLPQAMKLVSEPKEILHAYGKAILGQAIGVWAADNSQMFYGAEIDAGRVVTQMLAAQRRIRQLAVQVGLAVHWDEYYRIAGGLFGQAATGIEDIAEEHTSGGELLVSDTVYPHLAPALRKTATQREDLSSRGAYYSISDDGGTLDALEGSDHDYPAPFDARFLGKLRSSSLDELGRMSFAEYQHHKTVVFLHLIHREREFLLDTFTDLSLSDLSVHRTAASYQATVVKSTGALGIVLFDSGAQALAFCRDVIETNRRLGCDARAGVTRGDVYLFPLEQGGLDIAGNPINIAAKLAEDAGLSGILVHSSVPIGELLSKSSEAEPFRLFISKVELTGQRIAV